MILAWQNKLTNRLQYNLRFFRFYYHCLTATLEKKKRKWKKLVEAAKIARGLYVLQMLIYLCKLVLLWC